MERFRPIVELIGVTSVVVSLLFVGFELKQTREMNLAQLHFNRMQMYHSKVLATLESETTLNALVKRYTDRIPDELTETERATLYVLAQAQIAEWEAEYRYIEQGFATRSLEDLQNEISFAASSTPEIRLAWAGWDMPGMEKYSFNMMMKKVLNDAK